MRADKVQEASPAYGLARLGEASSYLQQAALSIELVEGSHRHNTVVSSAVLAAIAASDAATAFALGVVSRGGHDSAVKLLRQVSGSRQAVAALARLLAVKNDAQYLARPISEADAIGAMAKAEVVVGLATALRP